MIRRAHVSVPASSGNIGTGFDVLGAALTLRNELDVRVVSPRPGSPVVYVEGEGALTVPRGSSNVVYQALRKVFRHAGRAVPRLELFCRNRIPLARGLGSSSAAYLAGLLAANRLLGNRYSKEQILVWATELEGHPDNVAPALFGGVRASGVYGGRVLSAAWPVPKLRVVAAVPSFELSTKRARQVLPVRVPLKDAVFNLSSVALLHGAFGGRYEWLGELLNDRLHEPYRARLIPGFAAVRKAALAAGAYGSALSGAGPTIAAFAEPRKAASVGLKMTAAFRRHGVESRALNLAIDLKGALVR